MPRLPWFKFYPSDWLSSKTVTLMSFEQRGIYIELLSRAWSDPTCTIPTDTKLLQKFCPGAKMKNILYVMREGFIPHGVGLANPRLLAEHSSSMLLSEKARESANSRWNKDKQNATALPAQSDGNARQKADVDVDVRSQIKEEAGGGIGAADLNHFVSQKVKDIAIEKAHLAWLSFGPTVIQWATAGERLVIEDPHARTIFNQLTQAVVKDLIITDQKEELRGRFVEAYKRLEIGEFATKKRVKT